MHNEKIQVTVNAPDLGDMREEKDKKNIAKLVAMFAIKEYNKTPSYAFQATAGKQGIKIKTRCS